MPPSFPTRSTKAELRHQQPQVSIIGGKQDISPLLWTSSLAKLLSLRVKLFELGSVQFVPLPGSRASNNSNKAGCASRLDKRI